MAENIVINGTTYSGVKNIELKNTGGEPISFIRVGTLSEFSQVNPVVADYLVNVTYDPNDYSTSKVSTYNNIATDYRKDQPSEYSVVLDDAGELGISDANKAQQTESVTGENKICNLTPNVVCKWWNVVGGNITQSGTVKPVGQIRMLNLGNVRNVRDLGGWPCDGGKVRYGRIFRGGALDDTSGITISVENIKMMRNLLGIRHEIDFRIRSETGVKTTSVLGEDVWYDNFPVGSILNDYSLFTSLSGEYAGEMRSILTSVFEDSKNNCPVFIHCSAGADRTGVVSFVLNGLLGVSQSDLDKDYELSSFGVENDVRRRNLYGYPSMINYFDSFPGDNIRDKIVGWAVQLGLSIDDINTFRHTMIDGTPDNVTVPVSYNNLADPTSSDWRTDQRLSSSGFKDNKGTICTNLIPCKVGDVIRIKGLDMHAVLTTAGSGPCAYVLDSNKNRLGNALTFHAAGNSHNAMINDNGVYTYVCFTQTNTTTQNSTFASGAYMQFTANEPVTEVVITVNEEIP